MWGKIHIKNFVIFIFIFIGLFLFLNLVYAGNCDIEALIKYKKS